MTLALIKRNETKSTMNHKIEPLSNNDKFQKIILYQHTGKRKKNNQIYNKLNERQKMLAYPLALTGLLKTAKRPKEARSRCMPITPFTVCHSINLSRGIPRHLISQEKGARPWAWNKVHKHPWQAIFFFKKKNPKQIIRTQRMHVNDIDSMSNIIHRTE